MDLHQDERVLYDRSPSWRSQLKLHVGVVAAAFVVGAIVILAVDTGIGVAAGVVLALLGVGLIWLERSRTKYVITTHRIRVREGLVAREVQETRLERIQNVTTDQSVLERLLMIGDVDYDTAGDDGSRFRMNGVPRPQNLVRLVDEAQRKALEAERAMDARAGAEADAAIRSRRGRDGV